MPVYELLPDSAIVPSPCTVTGAASAVAALADASDGSYVVVDYGQSAKVTTTDPGAVTGRLCSIGAKVRAALNGMDSSYAWINAGDEYGSRSLRGLLLSQSGAVFADNEILAHVGVDPDPATGAIDPDTLLLELDEGNYLAADRAKVSRGALELYYLPAVTVTSVPAPTGTVTTTQCPPLTAALALTVETWQLPSGAPAFLCGGDVQYQVFRSADAPGSTPPAGVTPVWSGSTRFSEATAGARTPSVSVPCGTALANGTYVVFARASRDLMAGPGLTFSAWNKSATWTQNVPPPATPTLTAAQDTANQRVTLSVTVPATSGFTTTGAVVDVQRQVSGGWRSVRGDTGLAWTADGVAHAIAADYEADRGVTNTYRVRVAEIYTASGGAMVSAWATATATGPALTGTGWNFKAVDLIASSWMGANVVGDPTQETQRTVSAIQVLDRPLPVSVGGVSGGMADTYLAIAYGAADVAALMALRDYTGVVYLEAGFGDAKWVRITDITWTRAGTPTAPRLHATIKCTEVASGLAVSLT